MGLFSGISHALSNAVDSATNLGNNLVLGPTGALINGIVDIKDPIDKTWKTITPWNDNSEGALGIGKITPWKESGDLVSPSTFADAAATGGTATSGVSSGGSNRMTDIIIIYQNDEQIDGLTVTPCQTDGTDKMCLCRCDTAPEGIIELGTYDEVFADPEKKAIYDRLYPPTYIDEDGNEIIKPEKFGVFA